MIRFIMPYVPMAMILTAYCLLFYETWYEVKPLLSKKDCMIADISPDFSAKEKELCRDLRMKR